MFRKLLTLFVLIAKLCLDFKTKGVSKMVYDYSLLKKAIKAKFHSNDRFADAIGMGRTSLHSKLIGKTQFKQKEMSEALKALGLEEEDLTLYFFTLKV